MTESERQKKLKSLRKRLAGLHAEIAELANQSRAVQANVREAVDICEKEIHYYENMQIDSEAFEVTLVDEEGKKQKFWVVEHNPEPAKNIVSSKSVVGRRLLRSRIGVNVQIDKDKYRLLKRERIKLEGEI